MPVWTEDGRSRRGHRLMGWVAAALAVAVGLGCVAPAWADDDLEQRQNQLAQQVDAAGGVVDGAAALVQAANQRVSQAQDQVASAEAAVRQAQADLAAARAAVAVAREHEAAMAAALQIAQDELAQAQARERRGQDNLAQERDHLAQVTALNFQQGGSLISVAAVLNFDSGATDLANRIQWAENAVQSSQSSLDRLETIQRLLIAARGDTAVAEARADDAKRAADEQLAQTEAAEAEAALAEQTLSAALDERRAALAAESQAQSQAEAALAEAQSQLDALRREQAEVADEIARRAEAARQAAAAAAQPPGGGYSGVGSSGLIRPIPTAWISSPYGWRYNPIGGFSELHDGTDFAANCWTPILAVASGRVIKSYFGDGYGYRVFVEHGWVGGQFMTSAYNHMVQPGLPVGSWVNQGDVVGYVGTTGYSTGCHLHFHLYVNGSLVNPMSYLP